MLLIRSFVLTTILLMPLASLGEAVGAHLGHLTWPEAEKRIAETPIVIVPFGAGAKEHGPHLPMNADQVVMEYLLQKAIDSRDVGHAGRFFRDPPRHGNDKTHLAHRVEILGKENIGTTEHPCLRV